MDTCKARSKRMTGSEEETQETRCGRDWVAIVISLCAILLSFLGIYLNYLASLYQR